MLLLTLLDVFHSQATMRWDRNDIEALTDDEGVQQTESEGITQTIVNYFSGLFSASPQYDMDEVLNAVTTRVTPEMNTKLCMAYMRDEIEKALKQMHPRKASGPDDMNSFFYQCFWEFIGDDVVAAVLAILDKHAISPSFNHTFVALIPKKPCPMHVSEFRPISLCNVPYKLVTKVITNCLKPILQCIIFETQEAFTQGRLSTDNILIAYETFHAMRLDSS